MSVPVRAGTSVLDWVRRLVHRADRPHRRTPYSRQASPEHAADRLARSVLFDGAWYAASYPDVTAAGIDPLQHYVRSGAQEGRDPHPLFNTGYYLSQVEAQAEVQPLLHYLDGGPAHTVSPHPFFDGQWYCARYPEAGKAGLSPLEHYLAIGAAEGRDPSPHFSTKGYLAAHPEVKAQGMNPLVHLAQRDAMALHSGPDLAALAQQDHDDAIHTVEAGDLDEFAITDRQGIVIVIPSTDPDKARATARLLLQRAGMKARVVIAHDSARSGFIATLNAVAARMDVKYIVYTAEDAYPGLDWLRTAHTRLEASGQGLLAFNCGKWRGRIAAFGMVRTAWVAGLYGGPVFHPGYRRHKADNELTVIARITGALAYEPDAVLVEIDAGKVFVEQSPDDRALFCERFRLGFDGRIPLPALKPLAPDYYVEWG